MRPNEGIRKDIKDALQSSNKHALTSYLALVNLYNSYLENASSKLQLLQALIKVFVNWNSTK